MKAVWIILAVVAGLASIGVVTAGLFTNWKYSSARKQFAKFEDRRTLASLSDRLTTLNSSHPMVCHKLQFVGADDPTPLWLGNDGDANNYDFFIGDDYNRTCMCAAQVCVDDENCEAFSIYEQMDDNNDSKFTTSFFTSRDLCALFPKDDGNPGYDIYLKN